MCPFCWIGKRKFEQALEVFQHKDLVEIEWKAFQLDPTTRTNPSTNIYEMLAEKKGISKSQAKQMIGNVSQMASSVGLEMNFDKAIIANSHKAHRFSAFAKKNGKGIEAEEQLFKAYFTDGKNIDDSDTLLSLGSELGLSSSALREVLESNQFSQEVAQDIATARQLGVSGVPYFKVNNKYAISGAQDVSKFTQTLERAYGDWVAQNPQGTKLEVSVGESCDMNGNCK